MINLFKRTSFQVLIVLSILGAIFFIQREMNASAQSKALYEGCWTSGMVSYGLAGVTILNQTRTDCVAATGRMVQVRVLQVYDRAPVKLVETLCDSTGKMCHPSREILITNGMVYQSPTCPFLIGCSISIDLDGIYLKMDNQKFQII